MNTLFPLPYAHWYAATLFMEVGCSEAEVLSRLGLDTLQWQQCKERYSQLHFANTSWVAHAYQREGLPDPEQDQRLYEHLTAHDGVAIPVPASFSMRRELAYLRKQVEANPRIGPFRDVDWVVHYLCERRFPTIRYLHDGHHVFVDGTPISNNKGQPLTGVDPYSFRPLGDRWFRDNKHVYGQGETSTKRFWFVARHADPNSFTVLNERYGADKAAGYYITNLRLPTEEPGSFEIVSYYYGSGQKPGVHTEESHYAKDSRKVYAYGVAIEGADAPSFQAIGDEGKYFADQHRIYWENKPILDADRASFICASEAGQYHAYDCNRPYYAGQAQSVSGTFEHWTKYFETHPEIHNSWWHQEKARRATASSPISKLPVSIGGPYYSDGSRILVRPENPRHEEWVSLDHFDYNSFHHLDDVFGQDKHGLRYFIPGLENYGCEPVKGADPASFIKLNEAWFKDKQQVYYFDSNAPTPQLVIIKADMTSFEVLGGAYARDAKSLIVEGVRKRGITNSTTVQALGFSFARTGNTLLYRGKPASKPGKVDPITARGIHPQLLIDASGHMLFGGSYRKPIPGLDPASLHFLNHVFASDCHSVYALTDASLILCPDLDPANISLQGAYAIVSEGVRFHVAGGTLHATPCSC